MWFTIAIMAWLSLASTLLGAVIGVGSAFIIDRDRFSREQKVNTLEQRRIVYADYLSSLSRTRNELRLAAHRDALPLEERVKLAEEAFKEGQTYELRYKVSLLAPVPLVEASDAAFRSLRRVRDVVAAGGVRGQADYIAARDDWEDAFASLREKMRRDLGINDQPDP